ncbi:hypothetical protein BGW36DRAFT_358696 [Talaromyces proteolyticus]|uniref:Uncharacterized protein n=1 Tax=Talaromyces proteolyticus TaxID=1131652 RepID=A0AAD4PZM7_9EURO|nr:uncharacterized protein BGW36DRAFT_358696 [Talaromyces proteolyticus]KAH8699191.1 hypothetical protein BGW36DRAFT_358696 [Talaromyces proteolyticus]
MASRNTQTVDAAGHGAFHPNPPRETPKTEKWHKPGAKVSAHDQAPEFHAQTLPPGTAPASSSYLPNPINETPSQANNDSTLRGHGKESVYTNPLDSYPGATSADVDKGFGKPMDGQTSNELRHNGEHHRKHHGSGYEGVGGTGHGQRGLERDWTHGGQRGDKGAPAAEDMLPESAETIAREHE